VVGSSYSGSSAWNYLLFSGDTYRTSGSNYTLDCPKAVAAAARETWEHQRFSQATYSLRVLALDLVKGAAVSHTYSRPQAVLHRGSSASKKYCTRNYTLLGKYHSRGAQPSSGPEQDWPVMAPQAADVPSSCIFYTAEHPLRTILPI